MRGCMQVHPDPPPSHPRGGSGGCRGVSWWLVGGCLSDNGVLRVVSDNCIMAVTWHETGGWC